MTHEREMQDRGVPVPGCRELADAELDGVTAGGVVLVHEQVHVGTSRPPRTGGSGTGQVPSVPVRPPRSPPTGFP